MDHQEQENEQDNESLHYYAKISTDTVAEESQSLLDAMIMVSGKVSSFSMTMLNDESTAMVSSNTEAIETLGSTSSVRSSKVNSALICEVMKNGECVKILPILLGMAGFIESNIAKDAIKQMIESNVALLEGYSSHHLIATKDYQLAIIDPTIYNYSILSYKSIGFKNIDTEVDEASKFNEMLLDDHMKELLIFLKDSSQINTTSINKIISSIRKGRIALIKVWNISFNTNVLYFLRSFSDHLTHLRLWLFTDFNELEMGLPITEKEESIKLWFTCLHYLLRSVKLCNGAAENMTEQKPCRVFVSVPENNSKLLNEEVIQKIQKLEESLRHGAKKFCVHQSLKEKVATFDSKTKYHSYLKELLLSDSISVPLSQLFLRGALENWDAIFINKSKLCSFANNCHVDTNYFCKLFTSFGSLFDVSLVQPNSDIVIIKPDVFLAKINSAFDCIKSDNNICNGILNPSLVYELFGPEASNFMAVLSDVGMCAVIQPGKYKGKNGYNSEIYYYMPCARKMKQSHSTDENTAVQLLLDIQRPPNFLNYEVFFTSYILSNSKFDCFLESSEYENVTIMTHYHDSLNEHIKTSISYRGSHVEIGMIYSTHERFNLWEDHIECVISAAELIATTSVQRGRFTYGFAIICSEDGEYHLLPDELCSKCKLNLYFQVWTRALIKKPILEKFKFKAEISLEDATFLAREMLSFNEDVLISFGKQFDTDVVLVDYKSFTWAYVMAVLTKWMKTNHKATKADLARKILALSSVSKTTKDAADLKKLARQLFQRVIKETSLV